VAVDQDGHVLDILVERQRDTKAVKKFFRTLLRGLAYVPRVIIADKLKSYGTAKQEILPGVEHRQQRYLNTARKILTSPPGSGSEACNGSSRQGRPSVSLLRMANAQHVRLRRHRFCAPEYCQEMRKRFQVWGEITGTGAAA